jgi:hypothetical protein
MQMLATLAPLAALFIAASAAPAAFAEWPRQVEITFRYNADAPPEATLARLREQANKACWLASGRTDMSRVDRACAKALIAQTIDRIGDARLSQLGRRPIQQGSATSNASGR